MSESKFKIRNCKDLSKRSRYWAAIIYPESCNPDYINILTSSGIKCAISPLHDSDVYINGSKKGQLEKPHYHILFAFNGGYQLSSFDYILEEIKAFNTVEIVKDGAAYHDYEFHKGRDDKASYDANDITYINSNIYDYSHSEYKDIIGFINDFGITSFKILIDRLIKEERDNLLIYCSKNAYFINQYLYDKSKDKMSEINGLLVTIIDICDNIDDSYFKESERMELKNIRRVCTDAQLY